MRRLVPPCLVAVIGVLMCAGTASAADRQGTAEAASGYVPGQVLVRFKPGVDGSERAAARRKQDARVEDALEVPRVQLLELEPGTSVPQAVAAFERDSRVEYAEPNYRVQARAEPNDPEWSKLWGLHNLGVSGGLADADIDAPEAWDVLTDASPVIVGVVDTGVSPDHPDLISRLVAGKDWVHDDMEPGDLNGHGTHVAGTVGAEGHNALGVTGVAWNVKLMPLRVLDNEGDGSFADVANAFAYAGDNGVAVVNASLGGTVSGMALQTLQASIEDSPGTLFVVAAGNETTDLDAGNPDYPCSLTLENVLCVAASNKSDAPASFTNYGSTSVDLAAPGVGIQSTEPDVAVTWDELFDGGLADWTPDSDDGSTPTWATSSLVGHWTEGPPGLVDSPDGPYENDSDTYVRTSNAVAVANDCELWFDLKLDVDPDGGDRFLVEAAEHLGGPWKPLYSRNSDTTGFITPVVDLRGSGHDFYGKSMYLRFRLDTDGSGGADGAAVDWVEVRCHGGEAYGSKGGTSMATPHVAGAAALVLAKSMVDGALSPVALKQRLLDTGDRLSCWDGLTVTGARLNLARALDPGGPYGDGAEGCPVTITRAAPPPPPSSDPPPTTDPPPSTPPPPAPPPAPPTGTTTSTPVDDDPPVVRVSAARRYRAATLIRRGLRARIGCDERCSLRADVLVGRRTAKRYGIRGRRFGRNYILLGRARGELSRAGTRTLTAKISRRAHRGLRKARSVRLVLRVLAADPRGNNRVTRRGVTVRR